MNTADTGKFICSLRKEKGLTQKQLAEKLNVTDKAVSKWETGRSAPDIALLEKISEALEVSVVEILQGEKITTESFPEISNELVVTTIKKNRRKLKCAVIITAIMTLTFILLIGLSYPAHHYFTSVPTDDENAILKQSEKYADIFGETWDEMKIVKELRKGDFYFYLLQNDKKTKASMRAFKRDKIFKDRISLWGGGGCDKPGEVSLYCSGLGGSYTVNVFYGYRMKKSEYSYIYRGVKCTKPIEDEAFLDALIDIDHIWTHASIIYDE